MVTGPDRGGYVAWLFTSWAIRWAGGKPVRATPRRPRPTHFHGLVLGGGADVSPAWYARNDGSPGVSPRAETEPATGDSGQRRRRWFRRLAGYILAPLLFALRWVFGIGAKRVSTTDRARDELELALIDAAARADLPVLGICRGAQLLNVHAGGTLHQDLSGFYTEEPAMWTVFPRKRVTVAPKSRLARALDAEGGNVNSLHRQAIARLGQYLQVVARDRHDVVQAVEAPTRRFWIGVQWHPEYLPQLPEQRRLLRTLVDVAKSSAARNAEPFDALTPAPTRAAIGSPRSGATTAAAASWPA